MGFQIGALRIPYYGFFIAVGVAAAFLLGLFQVRLFRKDGNDFLILVGCTALGGLLGAKILYLAVSWNEIDLSRLLDPNYFNSLMAGGFVFYGGLIGGLAALFFCGRLFRLDAAAYLKICICCLPLAHGFGRLGCGAAGCCYGIPYDGIFSVCYEHSLFAPNHIALFPVQALEACCNFAIAAILLMYIDLRRECPKYSLGLYVICYAPVRFVLEFFRYDDGERGIYGIFSTSQWISIFLMAGAVLFYLWQHYRKKAVTARSG